MAIVSGGGGGAVSAAAIEATFTAAGQVYQGTGAGTGALVLPPGFEIGYAQITAFTAITDTLEATATALISSGALTFDGSPVICEVVAPFLQSPSGVAGQTTTLTLFEGATEIARLAIIGCLVAGTNAITALNERLRFTPTAGAHTYKVCGFVTATTGSPGIGAGATGTGAYMPAFLRFTKV